MRLWPVAVLPIALAACGGAGTGSGPGSAPGPRAPTQRERAALVADVKVVWRFESSVVPHWARPALYRRALLPRHLHPEVISVRVSRTRPRFASAAVELWGEHGRWSPGTAVLVFRWVGRRVENFTRPGDLVDGPATV